MAASPRTALPPRAAVCGVGIDRLTMDETVERCLACARGEEPVQHVVVNAAKIVAMRRDPELARIVRACPLVNADGQSVVWASHLLGDPLPERVAGIDLMQRLLAAAARERLPVAILGARQDVLDDACANLRRAHPGLDIAWAHHGWFDEAEAGAIAASIRAARPAILLVAMTSPRKERWLAAHLAETGVPFAMGVGGAIDVAAGRTRRAPRVLQRLGLEWLFRVAQEPRRLGRRYLDTNARFVWMVAREAAARRLHPSG